MIVYIYYFFFVHTVAVLYLFFHVINFYLYDCSSQDFFHLAKSQSMHHYTCCADCTIIKFYTE